MKRDYSNFIDETYIHNEDLVPCIKEEIKKTIKEDPIDDAVENIMELIFETRYEW
jgi:hypothetical protein